MGKSFGLLKATLGNEIERTQKTQPSPLPPHTEYIFNLQIVARQKNVVTRESFANNQVFFWCTVLSEISFKYGFTTLKMVATSECSQRKEKLC